MPDDDPIARLRDFVYDRWAAVRENNPRFRDCGELRMRLEDVTSQEARWFLDALVPHGKESQLFEVEDDNKYRSDRIPPNAGGAPRGNVFFEKPGKYGTLRLETVIHQAATWRLHDEFGWPRSHLIVESPDVVDDQGRRLLRREALDVLLLEEPCVQLPSEMNATAARSRVGVEAKADASALDRLVKAMRDCQQGKISADDRGHRNDHKKCIALDVLRPRLFLAIAAGETWRLIRVVERNGRTMFADELAGLDELSFAG